MWMLLRGGGRRGLWGGWGGVGLGWGVGAHARYGKGLPAQTFLELQEACVPGLLHFADAKEATLPALMPPPDVLDVRCSSIQLWIPLQPLPCDVPPTAINPCSCALC